MDNYELLDCPVRPPGHAGAAGGDNGRAALFLEQGMSERRWPLSSGRADRSPPSVRLLATSRGCSTRLRRAGAMVRCEPGECKRWTSCQRRLLTLAYRQCDRMRSPRAVALMRMLIPARDRAFAAIYRDLHIPAVEELSNCSPPGRQQGGPRSMIEAAAKLLLSIVIGD